MKQVQYEIRDNEGIHARPAGLLVKEAAKFQSSVMIEKGEKKADAKKIFGLMGMGVKCGETIILKIEGEDEAEAAAALETFLKEHL